ncbi:PIR protein [Plasmodium vivax]|nr:PIR protein [Plasmodium vivax]
MDGSNEYNSFQQYSYNDGIYNKIKGAIGDEFDSFPNVVLGDLKENTYYITLDCLRLRKYLMKFLSKEDCTNQNCCQYINYLLNKAVHRVYRSNKSIFDIYNKYMKHNNNNNEIMHLCLPEINYMDLDKYNKIDKLYSAYNKCMYYISNKHDRMSCYRAKSCASAYNIIMTEYIKRDDTKFCKPLKDLKDILEANEPSPTSNCDSSFSVLLSDPHYCIEQLHKSEKINESMEHPNVAPEVHGALGEPSEGPRKEIPGVGSPGVEALGITEFAVAVPEGGIETEEIDTLSHTQSGSIDISADLPSANTPPPAGTIIGTTLGFFIPLTMLYKFTPLGNWVNTKILGRDKLIDNMRKNERDFLLNSAQSRDINSGDIIYRIKYNSV